MVNNAANNHCIPSVIQMNAGLSERNLEGHVDFFARRLQGLPSRLPSIYTVYRYFAFEVILNMQMMFLLINQEVKYILIITKSNMFPFQLKTYYKIVGNVWLILT